MLELKDKITEVVSSHRSVQSFNLKRPQLMLKLKEKIKEVKSIQHSIHWKDEVKRVFSWY